MAEPVPEIMDYSLYITIEFKFIFMNLEFYTHKDAPFPLIGFFIRLLVYLVTLNSNLLAAEIEMIMRKG
jgi:hypothetical protein